MYSLDGIYSTGSNWVQSRSEVCDSDNSVVVVSIEPAYYILNVISLTFYTITSFHIGGRRSPAVACWASDHWVTSLA